MNEYLYRNATVADIPFLVDVIIEAEKSGSNTIGLAKIFDINEQELRKYLKLMLEEEIDGCEFSISSFVVAEYNRIQVAAFAGWIEGKNEDNLPSSVLKSNLFSYVLPKEKFLYLHKISEILKETLIKREPNTHQLEYAFVKPEHKGKGLIGKIIEKLLEQAKSVKKSQIQVVESNRSAISAYKKSGYKIVKRFESKHPEILKYLPCNVKLLMEKTL